MWDDILVRIVACIEGFCATYHVMLLPAACPGPVDKGCVRARQVKMAKPQQPPQQQHVPFGGGGGRGFGGGGGRAPGAPWPVETRATLLSDACEAPSSAGGKDVLGLGAGCVAAAPWAWGKQRALGQVQVA